jgi:hypothetical protein
MLAILAIAGLLEFSRPVNHDVAWILTVADLMHAGRQLYRDIIEINPPLIFWSAAGMRGVASAFHITPETVYRLLTLLLGLGSALSVRRLTRSAWPALALLAGGLILIGPDFGQRDVLTVFLMAPYVTMASMRSRPRHAWLIGVAAALGICLKPFYLMIWLVLAPFNRTRAADAALVLCGPIYLAAIALFSPAYIDAVRTLGSAYASWQRRPSIEFVLSLTLFALVAIGSLALANRRRHADLSWVIGVAAAALAAHGVLVLQGKSYSYYWQPEIILGLVAAVALAIGTTRSARVTAVALAGVLSARAAWLWRDGRSEQATERAMAKAVAELSPPVRTVFVSNFLFHGPPAFRLLQRPWRLSAPHIWWLTESVPDAERARLSALMAADIDTSDAVIVDQSAHHGMGNVTVFGQALALDSTIARALGQFAPPDTSGLLLIYRRHVAK